MKIGERVVLIEDYGFAKKGMTGIVIKPEYRIFGTTYCVVEFDNPCEAGEGGCGCRGLAPSGCGYHVPISAIKLLGSDKKWKIIITANGDATTAKLIQEGKRVKEVSVNRYFEDEYNAEIGAKEAISKLFKIAGYTGKAMFVGANMDGCGFTRGKIYQFTDGKCINEKIYRRGKTMTEEQYIEVREINRKLMIAVDLINKLQDNAKNLNISGYEDEILEFFKKQREKYETKLEEYVCAPDSRWIYADDESLVCERCRHSCPMDADGMYLTDSRYCPHCGAKMD